MFCIGIQFIYAQDFEVKGTVTDQSGTTLPGVSVVVKETLKGTLTDFEGHYVIKILKGQTLQFSYLGLQTKEIIFNVQDNIDVVLKDDAESLNEVVVTALGIKRDKKALGYATQVLKADEFNKVNSTNFLSNISGKVAGVQVTGSSNGLTSSSRIVIRGESSLNINNNSPLFVVDGIPVNNNIYGVGSGSTNQADLPADYGNGAGEINQEDIASITVLKGAASSALYGSRAANGVILITTKSGKRKNGLGVSFSTSTIFSNPLKLWDVQNKYGAGSHLTYSPGSDTNLGPRLDGSTIVKQNGSPGYYTGQATALPLKFRYNLNDFFQTGQSLTNTLSINGATEKSNYRLSYTNSTNTGIVPNTDLRRNNFNLKANYTINDKWKINSSVNYNLSKSNNLLVSGYGSQGIMYNLIWNHTNVDLKWLKDYWLTKDVEQIRMFTWGDNIFKLAHENINAFRKNRLFGNISSTYQFNDNLSLLLRAGLDNSNDFRHSRRPIGSSRYTHGMYREQTIGFNELNTDLLLSYSKDFDDFSTKISIGAKKMDQFTSENKIEGKGLSIPGMYNLQNINVMPTMARNDYKKRINSVYTFVNVGYKNYLYLDLTARNDWSSTLPSQNNSYFYPSASLSFIPSSAYHLGKDIDYLKIRLNAAMVGNDTDPYRLTNTYNNGNLPGSLTNPSVLLNSKLKPEILTSYETGIEAYLFKKRLTVDATYFISNAKNQIIGLNLSQTTGRNSRFINAGKIQNSGIELSIGITPIKTDKFTWSLNSNFTKNRSKVIELIKGMNNYVIAQGPNGGTIEARVGGRMGDIYGRGYLRSPNGKIVYDSSGSPIVDTNIKKIGNYNPDWTLGISSNISYKGFNLYAQLDIRHGGKIYSMTNAIGMESGILAVSLPGRETGIVGPGVVKNSDGTYSPNTTNISAENWYYGNAFRRDNIEANSFDASFVKLRELSFSYTIPKKILKPLKIQSLTLAIVGNNLALWTKVPNIDPETQKHYVFITNNFHWSAQTIADIYKQRWQVELFFKWIKQNLKIKSFLGTTENAVMTQIMIALCNYLLLSYIKFKSKVNLSLQRIIRLLQTNLFSSRSLIELIQPMNIDKPPDIQLQLSLVRN